MKNFKNHLYKLSPEEMRACLVSIIDELGLVFHPDTAAEDYTDNKLVQCFAPKEQKVFNQNLNALHDFYGENIYSVSWQIWEEKGLK